MLSPLCSGRPRVRVAQHRIDRPLDSILSATLRRQFETDRLAARGATPLALAPVLQSAQMSHRGSVVPEIGRSGTF
jgi:hypothetical protein